jgi:hypothetical protein
MKRFLGTIAIAIAALTNCSAQTTQAAYQQQVFNNQTVAGYSSPVKNFNQASHWLIFCNGATGTGHIQLEGSYDANTAHGQVISNVGSFGHNQCGVIQAGGYYFAVWAHVFLDSGINLSVSAWYSGSTGAISIPANVGLLPSVNFPTYAQGTSPNVYPITDCDAVYSASVASNTTVTIVTTPAGTSAHLCGYVISGVGGASSVTDSFSTGQFTCSSTAAPYNIVIPQTNYFNIVGGGNLGFFYTGTTAENLCYTHGSSGSPVTLTVTYATY